MALGQGGRPGMALTHRIEPLLRIFERSWFTHLWEVQEILLASENTCVSGHYEMDWHSLAKAAA